MLPNEFCFIFVISKIIVLICLKNVVIDLSCVRDKYVMYLELFLESSFLVTNFFLLITFFVQFKVRMEQQEHHICVQYQPLLSHSALSGATIDSMNSLPFYAKQIKYRKHPHLSNPMFGSLSPKFVSIISTFYSSTIEVPLHHLYELIKGLWVLPREISWLKERCKCKKKERKEKVSAINFSLCFFYFSWFIVFNSI